MTLTLSRNETISTGSQIIMALLQAFGMSLLGSYASHPILCFPHPAAHVCTLPEGQRSPSLCGFKSLNGNTRSWKILRLRCSKLLLLMSLCNKTSATDVTLILYMKFTRPLNIAYKAAVTCSKARHNPDEDLQQVYMHSICCPTEWYSQYCPSQESAPCKFCFSNSV